MTYIVLKTGGKQIKANVGENIWVEKLDVEQNDTFEFKEILTLFDGQKLHIGRPMLSNVIVKGMIVKQGKAPKIDILRFKDKSNWERRQGHRQPYTKILLTEILLDGKVIAKIDPKLATLEENNKDSKVEKVESTKQIANPKSIKKITSTENKKTEESKPVKSE